jgi:glucosamine 6-phosphate synthetase-like amidotransferase/phosphosugar isomerase protein
MCNINAIYRKNGTTSLTGFIQSISANSFVRNDHGEGAFFSSTNEVIKTRNKIDYIPYKNDIENSKIVITHQRYSTSGFEVQYNHPFQSKEFVLVHNGVINQFLNGSGSDSSGFFNKFVAQFDSIHSHLSRQQKIIYVLKNLFRQDSGSYSILIYDKKSRCSYYFRNSPAINFYKNNDYLFITTESENSTFLTMISDEKFVELVIEPGVIYNIDEKARVFKLARLHKYERDKSEKQTKISDNKEWNFLDTDDGSYGEYNDK